MIKHLSLLTFCAALLLISTSQSIDVPTKIYGVNMGGWLVIEPFITPSLFGTRFQDEWTYTLAAKTEPALADKLKNHWNTFYTENDIAQMKFVGITHVRIPVPYWAVMTQEELDQYKEPWLLGQFPYLERVLTWLKKYNIQAILDLHTAPGSQNGFDNSGREGPTNWGTGDTIARTVTYVERWAQKIASYESDATMSDVIIGFELINEAYPGRVTGGLFTIKDYYRKGYDAARKFLDADKYFIILEEAFSAQTDAWKNFMPAPKYKNVMLDVHIYHCFDAGLRKASYQVHEDLACNGREKFSQTLPTFCGEWSVAYKNESAIAQYEPYPNPQELAFIRRLGLKQLNNYEKPSGIGQFYWTWKTESAPYWDWKMGVEGGWLPKHPSSLSGNACSAGFTIDVNNLPAEFKTGPLGNVSTTETGVSSSVSASASSSSSTVSSSVSSSVDASSSSSSVVESSTSSTIEESSTVIETSSSTSEQEPSTSQELSTTSELETSTSQVQSSTSDSVPTEEQEGSGSTVVLSVFVLCASFLSLLF